jgi:hypothetical protein
MQDTIPFPDPFNAYISSQDVRILRDVFTSCGYELDMRGSYLQSPNGDQHRIDARIDRIVEAKIAAHGIESVLVSLEGDKPAIVCTLTYGSDDMRLRDELTDTIHFLYNMR